MVLANFGEDVVVPVAGMVSVFVLFPLALAYARVLWKRSSEPRPLRPGETDRIERRLEQLQQSVEAMAIEVERISEGQRFVTKIMSERGDQPALGAPAAAGSKRRG